MLTNDICDCDFCKEIEHKSEHKFRQIYKNINSRIVGEDDLFVIMPTLGQLFKYSLLVLPKRHIETMAELNHNELIQLEELLGNIKNVLSDYGYVISFEHGAKKETGGSCGIYHAHIHILPVPDDLNLSQFFYKENDVKKFDKLTQCYESLNESSQYLMAMNNNGQIYSIDISQDTTTYPSQFFRQKIVDYYQLDKPWNWREYQNVEDNILETIENIHIA